MAPSNFMRIFPVIIASGFSAAVAQILLLRELMVLYYGIELCVGAVLAAWLIWSALGCGLSTRFVVRRSSAATFPGPLLIIAALILPLTLLFIRSSSHLWGIVPGEIPPLAKLLQISLIATFPFSLLSGALFGLCWGISKKTATAPMAIYVGEALGATVGGVAFYLLILCHLSALTILLTTSAGMLLVAAWFLGTGPKGEGRLKAFLFLAAGAAVVIAGLRLNETIDLSSRRMQWGRNLTAAKDTPYQNLVMLQNDRQHSIFSNGLWLFSTPDRLSREYAVHPALLQHPAPKSVLLLGGGPAGLPEEILEHSGVRHVDVVELDQGLTDFIINNLSYENRFPETTDRITWHYRDASEFLRAQDIQYDVVLMNVGDPVNAQMNRFYTVSFFEAVKNRLSRQGIFSFSVTGGEDMLGDVQARFLGSVYRTLGRVFPDIAVLPGDQVRFFAANRKDLLTENPDLLSDRIRQRGLHLSYVRQDTLRDAFELFRLRYFASILEEIPMDLVNKDFAPLCYVNALQLWAAQWHSWLGKGVTAITRIPAAVLWSVLLLVCLLVLEFSRIGRCSPEMAVSLCVASVGGLAMVAQMVLLIVFQIMEGAMFLHLALIVALFMGGLAAGAGWMSGRPVRGVALSKKRLVRVQALICLFPLILAGFFFLSRGPFRSITDFGIPMLLFPVLSLLLGILEGIHFAVATKAMAELGKPVSGIGGRLYAFDLVGSAGGLLVATFFLIPVLGPVHTLPMLSVVAAAGLLILYGRV